MRALKAVIIAVTFGALSATHAHAEETDIWGGPGGARFDLPCDAGEYLIGLAVSSGAWIDRVAPLCATWNYAEGRFNTVEPYPGGAGGSGGGGMVERLCPPGRYVRGLYLRATYGGGDPTEAEYISAIEMQCWAVATQGFVTESIGSYSSGLARQYVNCPRNQIAVGVIGRSGHFVDAIGLTCRRATLTYGTVRQGTDRSLPGRYRRSDEVIDGQVGQGTPAPRQRLQDIEIEGQVEQTQQSRENRDAPIEGANDLPGGITPH